MLTPAQRKCLLFIEGYQERNGGVSPALSEIAAALRLNIRHKARIHQLLRGLEERGFIRRIPYRHRAIEVLRPITREQWFQFCEETKELIPYRARYALIHNSMTTTPNAEPRSIGPGSSGVLMINSDEKV